MAFRSPPPHRYSRGNLYSAMRYVSSPSRYQPHQGNREVERRKKAFQKMRERLMAKLARLGQEIENV